MSRLDHPVTAEELLRLPDAGVRRELIRGEVREMTPAGGEHGFVTGDLHGYLFAFVHGRGLGRVTSAKTGFILERDPDTVRAPDCAFFRAERLPKPLPRGYIEIAPDLVVETLSPGDRRGEMEEKVAAWLAFGVRLLWVIDPVRRRATVHRRGAKPRVIEADGALDGEDVVPGFRCALAELFG